MESSLQAQLALLRKRIEKVDARFAASGEGRERAEEVGCLGGVEVETELGRHLELERSYGFDHCHGSVQVERLQGLEGRRWVYLDTETTGLAGGAGTMAFLIGAAAVTAKGFELKQWFIREHGEEASALDSLARYLSGFDTVVTYNGRSYDQPLLETRYTLSRQRTPFARMEHLDLLYGARRLWKLRYESCRLVELERQILGHERVGDVPGELIPQLYFEFLRTGRAGKLTAVIEHNALDILSLAFLAAIIPAVFEDPLGCDLRHGAELMGLARWLATQDRWEEAAQMYRRALNAALSSQHELEVSWQLSLVEKKLGQFERAVPLWMEVAGRKNQYQASALCELAKFHEHRGKELDRALEYASQLVDLAKDEESKNRMSRILRKLGSSGAGRFAWS